MVFGLCLRIGDYSWWHCWHTTSCNVKGAYTSLGIAFNSPYISSEMHFFWNFAKFLKFRKFRKILRKLQKDWYPMIPQIWGIWGVCGIWEVCGICGILWNFRKNAVRRIILQLTSLSKNFQQWDVVYALWQEIPKLVYPFLTLQPVIRARLGSQIVKSKKIAVHS